MEKAASPEREPVSEHRRFFGRQVALGDGFVPTLPNERRKKQGYIAPIRQAQSSIRRSTAATTGGSHGPSAAGIQATGPVSRCMRRHTRFPHGYLLYSKVSSASSDLLRMKDGKRGILLRPVRTPPAHPSPERASCLPRIPRLPRARRSPRIPRPRPVTLVPFPHHLSAEHQGSLGSLGVHLQAGYRGCRGSDRGPWEALGSLVNSLCITCA